MKFDLFDRKIQYFLELSRSPSIQAAAQKLYITQSALSQSLKQLEEALGAPLVERLPKGIHLTPKGQDLAKMLLEISKNVFQDFSHQPHSQPMIPIRFGSTIAFGWKHLYKERLLDKISARFGPLQHYMVRSQELYQAVERGALDFAIVGWPKKPPLKRHCFLYQDTVGIIGHRKKFPEILKAKSLKQLSRQPWVHFPHPNLGWNQVLSPLQAGFVTSDVFEWKEILLGGWAIGEGQLNLFSKAELKTLAVAPFASAHAKFSIYAIYSDRMPRRSRECLQMIIDSVKGQH